MTSKVAGGSFGNSIRQPIAPRDAKYEPGPNDYRPMIDAIRRHIAAPVIPDPTSPMPSYSKKTKMKKDGEFRSPRPATSKAAGSNHVSPMSRSIIPGPGYYNTSSRINSQMPNSRKTTIAVRLVNPKDKAESDGPGPTYKPIVASTTVHKPAFNIGGNSSQRPELVTKTVI